MPQLQRFYCSSHKGPIDEVKIGGKLVPIVIYMVAGQVPDSGAPVDIGLGSGVKLPSAVRELMQPHVPVARLEFCVPCFAEHLGLKLFTAEDDPMYSTEQTQVTASKLQERQQKDPNATSVDTHHATVERALLGFKVGRGALKAPKLPPVMVKRPIAPAMPPRPARARKTAKRERVLHVEPAKG